MSVRSLGSLSLGQVSVGAGLVLPMLSLYQASLVARLVDLQASMQVSLGFGLPDPLQLITRITALIDDVDDILTKLPTASFIVQADLTEQISANIAETAAIGAIVAKLSSTLTTGGIEAYAFEGRAGDLGPELSRFVSGAGPANALVLVARDPAAWAALSTVLYTG